MVETALAGRFADSCHITCPSLPASSISSLRNPASTLPDPTETNPGFPLFTLLPFELRMKIWGMAIEPRNVVVNTKKRNKTPAVLHTCHEAREEGLRHYTLFFTNSPRLNSDAALELLNENPALQEVRHLALSRALWERVDAHAIYIDLYERIRTSKVLETLTIVNDRGSLFSGDFHFAIDELGYEEEISRYREGIEESATTVVGWNIPELRFARLEEKCQRVNCNCSVWRQKQMRGAAI